MDLIPLFDFLVLACFIGLWVYLLKRALPSQAGRFILVGAILAMRLARVVMEMAVVFIKCFDAAVAAAMKSRPPHLRVAVGFLLWVVMLEASFAKDDNYEVPKGRLLMTLGWWIGIGGVGFGLAEKEMRFFILVLTGILSFIAPLYVKYNQRRAQRCVELPTRGWWLKNLGGCIVAVGVATALPEADPRLVLVVLTLLSGVCSFVLSSFIHRIKNTYYIN